MCKKYKLSAASVLHGCGLHLFSEPLFSLVIALYGWRASLLSQALNFPASLLHTPPHLHHNTTLDDQFTHNGSTAQRDTQHLSQHRQQNPNSVSTRWGLSQLSPRFPFASVAITTIFPSPPTRGHFLVISANDIAQHSQDVSAQTFVTHLSILHSPVLWNTNSM